MARAGGPSLLDLFRLLRAARRSDIFDFLLLFATRQPPSPDTVVRGVTRTAEASSCLKCGAQAGPLHFFQCQCSVAGVPRLCSSAQAQLRFFFIWWKSCEGWGG